MCSILGEEKHNFATPLERDARQQGTGSMITHPVAHTIVGTAHLAENMIPGAHSAAVPEVLLITSQDVLEHNPNITKEIIHEMIEVCICLLIVFTHLTNYHKYYICALND